MDKMIECGFRADKLVHIDHFLEVSDTKVYHNPDGHILFFGRIGPEKGILTLIKAMEHASPKCMLHIVGDGDFKSECEDYVRRNNTGNVKFLGHLQGDKLNEEIRFCSFVVFPSQWFENMPFSILESFAHGKPVVGSNIGGVKELIEDGKTGLIFNPADSVDLSVKINALFCDKNKIIEMGRNARRFLEDRFDAQTHYDKIISLYKTVLWKVSKNVCK